MKTLGLTLVLLFASLSLSAQEAIDGIWNTGNENTLVEIKQADDLRFGEVVASDNAEAKLGAKLIKEIEIKGKEWKGKIYNRKKQKWYDATFKAEEEKLLITVKSGMLKKTIEWVKVKV